MSQGPLLYNNVYQTEQARSGPATPAVFRAFRKGVEQIVDLKKCKAGRLWAEENCQELSRKGGCGEERSGIHRSRSVCLE